MSAQQQYDDEELTGAPQGRPLPPPPPGGGGTKGSRRTEDDEQEPPRRRAGASSRSRPTVTLYVSANVSGRFERYRRAGGRGRTNTAIVLEAISSKQQELDTIIKNAAISNAPGGDLFPEDPATIRYRGSGRVQVQISLTRDQLAVLDRLTEQVGFVYRATWIAPVLNEFLPGKKDE